MALVDGQKGKAAVMSIAGHYIRTGTDSAEFRITPSMAVADRYHIEGLALFGMHRPYGPNMGILEFSADLDGNVIEHSEDAKAGHKIVLKFTGDCLEVEEDNYFGLYGINVCFIGTYKRASKVYSFLHSVRLAVNRLLSKA